MNIASVPCTGRLIFLLSAALVASGCSAQKKPQPAVTPALSASGPYVSTYAGDGRVSAYDGTTTGSTFIFPYGVAVGPDGTVYVADAGAHAIRTIKDGQVKWLAGDAREGPTPQSRVGAYWDGKLLAARFFWPTGVAVARDGSVYVADSTNHCIRKIQGGFVTTFAGRPKRGKRDGYGKDARFNTPESLAFDDDGNLYVADFGNGIRKITPAGEVSTLNLPSNGGDVIALDVRGRGENLTIAYTENLALHLIEGSRSMVLNTGDRIEPWYEFRTASTFYGVAILGEGTVAVTDVLDNAVRLVRFPGGPFFIGTMELPLGGGVHEGEPHGLFRDGSAAEARFDVPLGIARMPDGNLLVADGGNHRIRLVTGVDPRGPVRPDLKGLVGPSGTYRVAVLGNSFAFHDVLWTDSIAGQIEAGLKRDRSQVGLGAEPFVSTARLDAADLSDLRSFAKNYLGDGEADLVVLLVDEYNQVRELAHRPDIAANNRWQKVIPAELRAFQAALAKHGTQLLVVVLPKGRGEAIAELPHESVSHDGMVDAVNFEQDRQRAQNLERFYESAGVRTLGLQGPVERAEEVQSREQLYNSHDNHFSREGQVLIGREIVAELERWRPWVTH